MRRIFDNIISLAVVVIVLFLVIPLPPWILDFLLVLNIGLSVMILMITMNIKDALEFSIYPSLLLITTLYRLGLNVSTTRHILQEAMPERSLTGSASWSPAATWWWARSSS